MSVRGSRQVLVAWSEGTGISRSTGSEGTDISRSVGVLIGGGTGISRSSGVLLGDAGVVGGGGRKRGFVIEEGREAALLSAGFL